ncbi:hypothetical protein BVRB_7g170260 isoform B [Beta vulgaris subsp. vulgaris]|nr:hypothetical protein BVRB_7g170260 isoform B [Beta vulgaris subsp. vulgaris]
MLNLYVYDRLRYIIHEEGVSLFCYSLLPTGDDCLRVSTHFILK